MPAPWLLLTDEDEEEEQDRIASSSKGEARGDLESWTRGVRSFSARGRVRGVEVLCHASLQKLFRRSSRASVPLSLLLFPHLSRARARARSSLLSQFSLFREHTSFLSWTPWRLRGLPRYADGRARESRHRKKSRRRHCCIRRCLSQLAPLSLSFLSSQFQVFVGGLSWATDDARLRQYFSNFGEVSEVRKMEIE